METVMFISINRDKMVFLHKHVDHNVVMELSWIECPDSKFVAVENVNSPNFLLQFTDLELRLLFKHSTEDNSSFNVFNRTGFILSLKELAILFPESDADPIEVRKQADKIPDDNTKPYQYVKGSTTPHLHKDLWTPNPLRAALSSEMISTVRRLQLSPLPTLPIIPFPVKNATQGPTGALPVVNKPRQGGGIREIIWAIADEIWEKAGKPSDSKVVLSLRKEMMNALELDGIKRTTSSNELGNWQKIRIV